MANHGGRNRGLVVSALLGGIAGWVLHGQQPPQIITVPAVTRAAPAAATPPPQAAPPVQSKQSEQAIPPEPQITTPTKKIMPQQPSKPAKQATPKKPIIDRLAIIQQIIKDSLASYSGNCACPYNTDRAGRSCGRRSAYSRPSGSAPICFASDVNELMIQDWQKNH